MSNGWSTAGLRPRSGVEENPALDHGSGKRDQVISFARCWRLCQTPEKAVFPVLRSNQTKRRQS